MSDYDRILQEGLHYDIQESNRLRQRQIIEEARTRDLIYKQQHGNIEFEGFSFYDIYKWIKNIFK